MKAAHKTKRNTTRDVKIPRIANPRSTSIKISLSFAWTGDSKFISLVLSEGQMTPLETPSGFEKIKCFQENRKSCKGRRL